MTQELLARSGRGIAAPSANRFGRVSPTTAEHVVADLGPYLDVHRDVVLDGGPSPIGVESTIIDCTTDPPQLLRAGGIPTEDVERLLDAAVGDATGPSRAAGMLAAHYAPRARVTLVPDARQAAAQAATFERQGGRVAVLDHGDDLVTYARRLYAELRAADAAGADRVVAVLPPAARPRPRHPRPPDQGRRGDPLTAHPSVCCRPSVSCGSAPQETLRCSKHSDGKASGIGAAEGVEVGDPARRGRRRGRGPGGRRGWPA